MKLSTKVVAGVAGAVLVLGAAGALGWKLLTVRTVADPALAATGAFSGLEAPGAEAELRLVFLGPGGLPEGALPPQAGSPVSVLPPARLVFTASNPGAWPLYADPLGVLAGPQSPALADGAAAADWDRLWATPLAVAGGDDASLTSLLMVVSEAQGGTDWYRGSWPGLWADPTAGLLATGLPGPDHPLAPTIAFLKNQTKRGLIPAGAWRWTPGDVWLAVRDGRVATGLTPYSWKRHQDAKEAFSVEWYSFPPRTGRTDYAVGAVVVAGAADPQGWNPGAAWGRALDLTQPAAQALAAPKLGLVPLATDLPPFDRETRDARLGLSVAPVLVLPSSDADLPAGWRGLLEGVRRALTENEST